MSSLMKESNDNKKSKSRQGIWHDNILEKEFIFVDHDCARLLRKIEGKETKQQYLQQRQEERQRMVISPLLEEEEDSIFGILSEHDDDDAHDSSAESNNSDDFSEITHDRSLRQLLRVYETAEEKLKKEDSMTSSCLGGVSRETLLTIRIMQECYRIKGRIQLVKNRNNGSMHKSCEHNQEFFKYLRRHSGKNSTVRCSWQLLSSNNMIQEGHDHQEARRAGKLSFSLPTTTAKTNKDDITEQQSPEELPLLPQEEQEHQHQNLDVIGISQLNSEPRWMYGAKKPNEIEDRERPPPPRIKVLSSSEDVEEFSNMSTIPKNSKSNSNNEDAALDVSDTTSVTMLLDELDSILDSSCTDDGGGTTTTTGTGISTASFSSLSNKNHSYYRYRPNPFKCEQHGPTSTGTMKKSCAVAIAAADNGIERYRVIQSVPTDEMTTSTAEDLEWLQHQLKGQQLLVPVVNNPRWPLVINKSYMNEDDQSNIEQHPQHQQQPKDEEDKVPDNDGKNHSKQQQEADDGHSTEEQEKILVDDEQRQQREATILASLRSPDYFEINDDVFTGMNHKLKNELRNSKKKQKKKMIKLRKFLKPIRGMF